MKNKFLFGLFSLLFWINSGFTQPLILIKPNGGEVWQAGTSGLVEWYSPFGGAATIDIFLSTDSGQTYSPLAIGVADFGYYQVNPVPAPASNRCYVKILPTGNPFGADSSDAVFSITPGQPSLNLVYPNGGEAFAIGATKNITWTSQNVDTIQIEISTNNGSTWTVLQSDIPASNSSFPMLVSGPVTSNAKIRISDQNNPALNDVSASTFFILNPFITVSNPANNQSYVWGQNFDIVWNAALVSNYVNIGISFDGINFDTIVNNYPNTFSYTYTVPNGIVSNSCYVVVRDATIPTILGSNGPFTIQAPVPNVDILFPNGGESFVGTNLITVEFSSQYVSNGVIEYSLDSMQTWTQLGTFVQGESSLPWLLPGNVNSNDCFLRGYDLSGGTGDTSNAGFTISIPVPQILISVPFGSEIWAVGSTQQLSWASAYMSQVKIEYSSDSGATWSVIEPAWNVASIPYNWTVPGPPTNNAFIRLSDVANPSISATNPTPFKVVSPFLQILQPNGGESLNPGQSYLIQWTGSVSSGLINLDYTTDNGQTWNPIVNGYSTILGFTWVVPNDPSTNCKIRISETGNPTVTDQSNAVFTITQPVPSLLVTAPILGETWTFASNATIQWQQANVNNVDIFLSTDSGLTYTQIANAVPASQGFYQWSVVSDSSSNSFIIVKDSQSPAADTSNRFKIISMISGIQVLNPVGGENFPVGSLQNIQWFQGGVDPVNVEYSYNNGQNWLPIATNVPFTTGSVNWVVPSFISSQYLVRVYSSVNPLIIDESASFSVVPSFLQITYPNGGETFNGLNPYNITWQGQGISSAVSLEYSLDNGLTWNAIINNIPNSGNYLWLTPPAQSSQCRVRVKTVNAPLLSDVSNASFTIILPSQSVFILSPNGGENYGSGQTVNVQFASYQVNYVKIEYSLNAGVTWTLLTQAFPAQNGIYSWVIPQGINTTDALIRVSNSANIAVADQSNAPFSISVPSITLLNPNGGITLNPGTQVPIEWIGSGLSPFIKTEWSADSMLTWQIIQPSVQNNGASSFNVPAQPSQQVFFRVSDVLNPSVSDISNAASIISGLPSGLQTVLSPTGGEQWLAGQDYPVSWNFPQSSLVKIELSTNNGASWNTMQTSVNALLGTAMVTLPQMVSAQCLIKVSDASNPLVSDVCNAVFSIGNRFIDLQSVNSSHPAGVPLPLSWTSFAVGFVDLYSSTDGGNTWNVIDTNIYNQEVYVLPLPQIATSNYRIKIADSDFPLVSDSTAIFSISGATSLTWVSPVQNSSLLPGSSLLLQWQGSGYPFVKLEFSSNGGGTWQLTADSIPMQQGVFLWAAQGLPTTNGKFRITGFGSGTPQSLVAPFTLTLTPGAPSVSLVYPNGGEQLEVGSFIQITWNHNNLSLLDLSISQDGGASYSLIGLIPSATGSYLWQIPNTPGSDIRLRLSANGLPVIQDASDANFSIVPSTATGQTISIDTVSSFSVCRGDSLILPFSVNGVFPAGALFQMLIAEEYSNPPTFQLLKNFPYSGLLNDSAMASIPSTLSPGLYRLYIACSSPALISSASPSSLQVKGFDIVVQSDRTTATLPGAPISFSTLPSGPNYTYSWDFGFFNSNAENPQVSYSQTGFFGVSLTMVSADTCSTTINLPNYISADYLFHNTEVTTLADSSDFVSLTYHSQSTTWTAVASDGDVAVSSDGDIWNLGGLPQTPFLINKTSALRGQELFASGLNGLSFRSPNRGLTWTPFSIQTAETVNDMDFASINEGIACGSNGLVRRFNGSIWQPAAAKTNAELFACFSGRGYQLVAGSAGTIRRGVLSNWDTIPSPLITTWHDILMLDSLRGFICGANGSLAKTNNAGLSWQTITTGYPSTLRKLCFSGDTIWAAGDRGIIMESADNGISWIRKSLGTQKDAYSMAYDRGSKTGFVVGKEGLFRKFGSEIYQPPTQPSVVSTIATDAEFVVYPNPANDRVMFKGLQAEGIYFLRLFSADGRLMINTLMRGDQMMQGIDIAKLSAGLYLLNLSTSGWEGRQRLLIAR